MESMGALGAVIAARFNIVIRGGKMIPDNAEDIMSSRHKFSQLSLVNVECTENSSLSFTDFQIDKYVLSRHFAVRNYVGALAVNACFARQLMLREKSEFASGRVPIFVCKQCGDIGCGAITVEIEETEQGIIWREFGVESPTEEGLIQSDYMKRTGPFLFDKVEYLSVLSAYGK